MTTKYDDAQDQTLMTEEKLNCISKLRLIDDVFMRICFSDYKCAEYLLRTIMQKPDLKVKEVKTQYEIKSLHGRSVTLDIHATDSKNKRYDIEVQREDSGAIPKRARYHAAMMDYGGGLKRKEKFKKLPETYIIFLTENDVFKKGKPIYTIDRHIKETGEAFDDGMHILYVNGAIKDAGTELGRLMHDMVCEDPDDMYSEVLSDRVGYFKKEKKGVGSMCKELEEMMQKAKDQGKKQGEKRGEERARSELVKKYIQKSESAGKARDLIISELIDYFDYSADEAKEIYGKYALQPA